MRSTLKTLQDVNTLSEIGLYGAGQRRSSKPALPTTHILDLCMRKSERDRILRELNKLKKRKGLLTRKLEIVEKEMDKLLAGVIKTAEDVRGERSAKTKQGKGNTVLEY